MDRLAPGASLWILLGLSVTTGFAHGALDIELLLQRFRPVSSAMRLAALYLLVVVLLAWALSSAPHAALWLLLLMSIWHFGEDYGRWEGADAGSSLLTRLVVGGAPVMMPLLFSTDAMSGLLREVWSSTAAGLWFRFSQGWLLLLLAWMVLCGLRHRNLMRQAWYELAGVALLNLVFSPLLAFAIYFGVYHAPVHIWRVWVNRAAAGPAQAFSRMGWAVIFVMTLVLGAALWWALGHTAVAPADWSFALRWLVLALTALTLPHLVLVSLCARALSLPARSDLIVPDTRMGLNVKTVKSFDSGFLPETGL
jgi:beta-carotene 15,15'-dioxygenase